jgi:glycosyltransferase involved in cell wall biosynthesis
MSKISVCLATYNEEKNIKACLVSVKPLADEVVVVDGRSTDKTVKIINSLHWDKPKIKLIIRENPLMFHLNKQKAFDAAGGDWILYLDADERVTPALSKEILQATKSTSQRVNESRVNGYWIPRKNIIFGKWIKNSFWYPDYQLRLFKRGLAYLPCRSVHEQPKLKGKTGYLKKPLVHHNYQTVAEYVSKINKLYSENDARLYLKKGKKIQWHDALRLPFKEFLATFFARKAYQDGLHGLVLSLLQSFSALVTFAKAWESRGFPEQELPSHDLVREVKKMSRETTFWLTDLLLSKVKNPVKKIVLKAKRRWS